MKRSILRPVVLLAGVISIIFGNGLKAQDLQSAIKLMRSENYDKAEEMWKSLIQKNPADSKNYFYLGET